MINKKEFLFEDSKQLNEKYITDVENILNRSLNIKNINKILSNISITNEIEKGIFEHTLLYIHNNNLLFELAKAIYEDKSNDIISNIDINDKIDNKTLNISIKNGEINPRHVAFLSPSQLHPVRWDKLMKKKEYREYKSQNIKASSEYTCFKCKASKCKVSIIQTRSADEPSTIFVTCLECHNTFKK
jgi:DNA-directed RNA polymerase subunit M/transcription elongation factor TFIIS